MAGMNVRRGAALSVVALAMLALPGPARGQYPAPVLDRPEGTVKAQVHRGIALLRSMLEAEARAERQEMTA